MPDMYLLKEPLDLPTPLVDLPQPEKELPAPSHEPTVHPHHVRPQLRKSPHHVHAASPIPHVAEHTAHEPAKDVPPYTQASHEQAADYPESSIKTLLTWEGMGRPFHNHKREYYINASLIVMILEVLLFLFSQYVLMLVVLSMLFVVIALAIVPPHTVHYRISSEGVSVDEYFYLWQELYDFYFKRINGEDILHIRTSDPYTTDITIVLGDIHKDYIRSLLMKYLPYRESVPLTFIEKSGDWLTRTFPLDKMPHTQIKS